MTMRITALALVLMVVGCDRDDARPSTPAAASSSPAGGDTPRVPEGDAAGHGDDGSIAKPDAKSDEGGAVEPAAATVRLVDVDPDNGSLHEQIVAAAAQAKADGRSVAVELWAGWCPPCKKLDKLLGTGPVADAVANAVLIRVDTDVFNDELNKLGFDAPQIPSLYRIDERGKPKGKALSGAKWSRESETNIAAQLAAFLQG
jgi:thiol-disulfide isomerase/thioredoxin